MLYGEQPPFRVLHAGRPIVFNTFVEREKGVGSTADLGPTQAYDTNKTEVLRLLLVLLSRQIYIPPSSLLTTPSLYTLHFVQKSQRRDVLTILCSLLNTAMNSSQTSSATVMGGVAGRLPYNHLVFKGEDPRANLVSVCFQVLCAVLDFQTGSAGDIPTADPLVCAPALKTNAFRYFLAKVVRRDTTICLELSSGDLPPASDRGLCVHRRRCSRYTRTADGIHQQHASGIEKICPIYRGYQ